MILVDVSLLEIIEKLSSARDHLEQPATRVVVLLVDLEVVGELVDALRKKRDLHLRGTCIGSVLFEVTYDFFFQFCWCCHDFLL